MKTIRCILMGLFIIAVPIVEAGGKGSVLSKKIVSSVEAQIKSILPKTWTYEIDNNGVVPSGYEENGGKGISIICNGPTLVSAPRHDNVPESINIIVMPASYPGKKPPKPKDNRPGPQFGPCTYLGSNSQCKVYVWAYFPTPTWPSWKKDIVQKLRLVK